MEFDLIFVWTLMSGLAGAVVFTLSLRESVTWWQALKILATGTLTGFFFGPGICRYFGIPEFNEFYMFIITSVGFSSTIMLAGIADVGKTIFSNPRLLFKLITKDYKGAVKDLEGEGKNKEENEQ